MNAPFSHSVNILFILFSISWIIGFALILAALSIQHFNAQVEGVPFREKLRSPNFQFPLWGGLTLVSIGFFGNSTTLWEKGIWLFLILMIGFQTFNAFRDYRLANTHDE